MTPMLKTVLDLVAKQPYAEPQFRQKVRLASLEDTIMDARPDYCEAAESILAPMMAALERKYDWRECKSYEVMSEVKAAYQRLFKALMDADAAEQE